MNLKSPGRTLWQGLMSLVGRVILAPSPVEDRSDDGILYRIASNRAKIDGDPDSPLTNYARTNYVAGAIDRATKICGPIRLREFQKNN